MNRAQCAICVDFLTCEDTTAIPCGHTFHNECLLRWKEQASTCPQCRVKFTKPFKLYFELGAEDRGTEDPAVLKNQVTELNLKVLFADLFVSQFYFVSFSFLGFSLLYINIDSYDLSEIVQSDFRDLLAYFGRKFGVRLSG